MVAGYAPLPTQQPTQEADRELDEAFGFDEEDNEQHGLDTPTPFRHPPPEVPADKPGEATPAVYDFERDFDYARPPPGSPPRPSSRALPNNFGNSNGLIPSSPIETPTRQPSLFRRVFGAVLPTHYARLPTTHSRTVGGGTQNDGVFANVTAKPSRPVQMCTDDGDVYVMPEETLSTAPPSYAIAQADAVPPYWETTVHAPAGLDTDNGMIIDDLPSGSLSTFVITLAVSSFFQFPGFLITYLLHSTHAGKFGSRAGLGLTLFQYGFYYHVGEASIEIGSMENGGSSGMGDVPERSYLPPSSALAEHSPSDSALFSITSRELLSLLLMALGSFLFFPSLFGFWRIKRWEASIRASHTRDPSTAEEIERDIATRQTIESVFLLSGLDDDSPQIEDALHIPTQQELTEAQLQRDLHLAGLL